MGRNRRRETGKGIEVWIGVETRVRGMTRDTGNGRGKDGVRVGVWTGIMVGVEKGEKE